MADVDRSGVEQERQNRASASRNPNQSADQAVTPETNGEREQRTGLAQMDARGGGKLGASTLRLLLQLAIGRSLLRSVSAFPARRRRHGGWGRSAWVSGVGALVGGLAVRKMLAGRAGGKGVPGFAQQAERGVTGLLGATAMTMRSDSLAVGSAVAAVQSNPIAGRVERRLRALASRSRAMNGSSSRTARASITIGKSAEELLRLWREPNVIRQILGDLVQAAPVDGDGTASSVRWSQMNLRADAHIVEDRPDLLRWRSSPDAQLRHEGSVELRSAPGEQGTELTLEVRFNLPDGVVISGATPDLLARRAVRSFKSLAETGEIPTIAPQPAGRPGRA